MNLATIQDARQHIRTDSDADDAWFRTMLPAVSEVVRLWLKQDWRLYMSKVGPDGKPELDEEGLPVPMRDAQGLPLVRPVVRAAVLVELAQQYRFREGQDAPAVPAHWGHGYVLGAGATSLLSSLRRSTVA